MTLIVVTGMPGTGSSTVIEAALKLKLNEEGVAFTPMNYGDVMFEVARGEGLVEQRDAMRKLPKEKQQEIQRLASEKIADLKESMNLIIDTHCTIKTPLGYLPGLPEPVLRKIKPDLFVLAEANPDEIFARLTSAAVKIIRNQDGEVKKAAKEFFELIKS